ncbi:MAG: 4-hydroxythreonine-4-phosphate dehydrogenase PdxA [Proteobacteria bacterium]|uniref:4-hydroxythreonine-4-phosphate dehydrogenase PdxA n=1 Tax=Rudaea sp. TaxID=2136325 RepID=UPI001D1FC7D1|nr:4-hydroxythreonine-4-phosphate dehydrogenase PdxA [Pseudomonadota bacterium]MBS0567091.1 4-hydroxythreonine-4-phosphate dehydrogenase PdxA [Pseudomonadota bacterium]
MLPRIAITSGEPAGIGPELVAALAATDVPADLIAIADRGLLTAAAAARNTVLDIEDYAAARIARRRPGALRCLHVPLRVARTPGKLDPRNGAYVIDSLARAADGCAAGEFDALVTAPVQKSAVADAGIPFTGHTEFFAERAQREVVMMLIAPDGGDRALRVALATTHLPLARVPGAITRVGLVRTLTIVCEELIAKFGIAAPRVAVLGLNPHAGEAGHLGREEIDVIVPAIEQVRAAGFDIVGPLPADTAFVATQRVRFDAVLAMYHDQGLPVLKALGFGDSVNLTLGLPWIRTSVDHGTALDLAGTGQADPSSLIAATRLALQLVAKRH